MLIQALCEYYDVLAKTNRVLPQGYSDVNIHYLVSLRPDGEIDGIIDWRQVEKTEVAGKIRERLIPRTVHLPKRTQMPGIDGNIIEHRPAYLFGLLWDQDGFTARDRTQKAQKSHDAFLARNLPLIEGIHSPIIDAYRGFMQRWNPAEQEQNAYLRDIARTYSTSGFAFCLSGHPEILLHEDARIRAEAEKFFAAKNADGEETLAQCGILGLRAPIARLHEKIKNVPGGSSMGNSLISYKNASECSYGHAQSYNSNISEIAMMKYTEALNFLMARPNHRTLLDDMVIVHWAASGEERYDDLFAMLTFGEQMDSSQTDDLLKTLAQDAAAGVLPSNYDEIKSYMDPNVTFYIVGIKPNAARLAVKFICRQQFGIIFENLVRHQQDLHIGENRRPITIKNICREMVSPKSSRQTVSPAVMTKILEAAVYGYPYLEILMETMVRRVKTDSDEENNSYIKMNDTRMGVIKAYLNRRQRLNEQKEEITLALDKQNTNPAYLCGRLFAVLEGIQQRASNNSLNRTIKDAYFSAASSRPATIFPKLLRLSQYHIAKLDNPYFANKDIGEISELLGTEFPEVLSLVDQGKFMLGYYQQTNERFSKKKEKDMEANENDHQ